MRKKNVVKKYEGSVKKGLAMAMAAMMMVSSGVVPGMQVERVHAYVDPMGGEIYSDTNNLMYRLQKDGTCTVNSAEKITLTNIEIPSQIEKDGTTYTVVGIEGEAFQNCSGLVSVKIPASVQYIGESAFEGCSGLTDVEIAEGVTEIAKHAFYSCSKLKQLEIPDSVERLGYDEWDDDVYQICDTSCYLICSSNSAAAVYAKENKLNYLTARIAEAGTVLTDTKNSCQVKVVKDVTKGSTVSYVKSTKSSATSVTVPATVTIDGVTYKVVSIADKAFSGNKKLTKVVLGKNVKTIGKKAFANCSKLKKMEVKAGSLSVGAGALSGTNKSLIIKVPAGKVFNFKTYFKGKGNNKATINSTGKALPKKNLKQLGVPFDLKKNKTVSFKVKVKAVGNVTRTATVKSIKITKASKKGYKKAVIKLNWDMKFSKSDVHKALAASEKDGTNSIGGFFYIVTVDSKTGESAEKDNYGVSTKFSDKKYKRYKSTNGGWVEYLSAIKVTIIYPDDYKDLCLGVGGDKNTIMGEQSIQDFCDGKISSLTKTAMYKKNKKNCHFMQIK